MADSLPASDQELVLFAKSPKLYPRRVWGKFRKLKWVTMGLLLGIYYLAPWLRWHRGPYAPDQAILIDMPHRKAYFFFIEIWPQEVYFLAGILIFAAVSLFFVTSQVGRAWCGYGCPQTVWTDLFVWVERLVQGDRNARMKLDQSPWTWNKIRKKVTTHAIWLIIGLFTGGAWVFYFNDAPTLAEQIWHADVPWSVLSWIIALTLSTYIMAGLAREQVCTYMCPYARFQSAMFDKDTLIITYDAKRGEPRAKHKAGESWEGRGDCIDCDSCVVVCPMGIDIRNGLQYKCISCGLCVDACNTVMDKIGKPHGLIRYDTERRMTTATRTLTSAPALDFRHFLRPRTLIYSSVLVMVASAMLVALLMRATTTVDAIQDRNPLYVQLSNGDVRNRYTLHIYNKTNRDQVFTVRVSGLRGARVKIESAGNNLTSGVPVLADSSTDVRVIVSAPQPPSHRTPIRFAIESMNHLEHAETRSAFAAPEINS